MGNWDLPQPLLVWDSLPGSFPWISEWFIHPFLQVIPPKSSAHRGLPLPCHIKPQFFALGIGKGSLPIKDIEIDYSGGPNVSTSP